MPTATAARSTAVVPCKHGLHMRPTMQIVGCAAKFTGTTITITRADDPTRFADALSYPGIFGLTALMGEELIITAEGCRAQEAVEALKKLIEGLKSEE